MVDLAADFGTALEKFDLGRLEAHRSSVCAIRADGTIAYRNPAWSEFARANDGADAVERWPLGANLFAAIPDPLDRYYRARWELVASTGKVWTHEYECSSPTLRRRFRLKAYPLPNAVGVLLVHSLVIEEPHTEAGHDPLRQRYVDANDLAHQCMHCRRFRRRDSQDEWEFVPAWVQKMPTFTSHGLCGICFDHYFPTSRP